MARNLVGVAGWAQAVQPTVGHRRGAARGRMGGVGIGRLAVIPARGGNPGDARRVDADMRAAIARARRSTRSRSIAAAALGLLTVLAVLAALAPAGARGATPTPAPVDPFPTIQTWLDLAPNDPAAGPPDAKNVTLGATFWDVRNHALFGINGLFVQLYPAKGTAKPSEAKAMSDAPGHVTATLAVPKGGPGRVAIVERDQQCAADGTCRNVDLPLRIYGTGPPPDAPLGSLVRAMLLPITGDVVAGRPTSIAVQVTPVGLWTPDALKVPGTLRVTATGTGGKQVGSVDLQQDPSGHGLPYTGKIVISGPGQVVLDGLLVDADGNELPLKGQLGAFAAVGGGVRADQSAAPVASPGSPQAPAPQPSDSAGEGSGPPWILIGGIGLLILGLALFLGEPLTRRLRGGSRGDRR
jgi:hypothetical protein